MFTLQLAYIKHSDYWWFSSHSSSTLTGRHLSAIFGSTKLELQNLNYESLIFETVYIISDFTLYLRW